MPTFPNVTIMLADVKASPVPLITLTGRTIRLLRAAGVDEDSITAYSDEVLTAKTFDDALTITRQTITVKE